MATNPDPDPSGPTPGPTGGLRGSVSRLMRADVGEQLLAIAYLLRWVTLGTAVGVATGTASAVFLYGLAVVTDARESTPWLLYLLPLSGIVMGLAYANVGGRSSQGNNLVVQTLRQDGSNDLPVRPLPVRMAPLVLVGTWATHLFGGSAGREGTAIQMGASLGEAMARLLRLNHADRRLMLVAGVAGGFGSVFSVPLAGAVFALEVQSVGRVRHEALFPALTASVVGNVVFDLWNLPHDVTPSPDLGSIPLQPLLLAAIAICAVASGLISALFMEMTTGLKAALARRVHPVWLRPAVGGVAVILITTALGTQDYLGLSLPLIGRAFDGGDVPGWAFLAKLVLTAVTLAAGFQGGEVTPLFVIGATLGAVLGPLFGGPTDLFVAAGFLGVFAAATNTPLACTIMGVELFGVGALPYLALACVVAYICSAHRGIYETQTIGARKVPGLPLPPGTTVADEQQRRRFWLPWH